MSTLNRAELPSDLVINPHETLPISLASLPRCIWRNRHLIASLSRREVAGRYKGSAMGLAWSLFNPILMLLVFTFVFSVVFKSRWGVVEGESEFYFSLVLFVGMIVNNLFSEVVNGSPRLILLNVNFVKKVVFPLEILPVVAIVVAVFQSLISLAVLLVAFLFLNGYLHWTIVFFPAVIFPFVLVTLGFSWMLASLGVFLRDVGQSVGIATTVVMFLAPVFYPTSAIPAQFRPWIMANPLTFIIEQAREVLIWGHLPNFAGLAIYLAVSVFVAWLGFVWFQKTRKGFADVL